jgi:hypothetical protein
MKKFTNLQMNEDFLRVGKCTCCGCDKVLVNSHECFISKK